MASTLTVVSRKQQSRAKIKLEIEKLNLLICQDYPRNRLDHEKLLCMLDPSAGYVDPNADYGAHRNNLQFPVNSASSMKLGTQSLGLRYENEHSEVYYGYKMCQFSRQHLQFLLNIQRAIYLSHPSSQISNATQDYMRVNLVVGAQTGEHADTFRGATPNFIFIEPGNTFHLRIRLFPKFHSSVVSYKGDYYIPHQYSPRIGKNDKGDPHYFEFPPSTFDKLEPVGDLHSFIVVGIKQKKIQTAPRYYSVHHTTATLNIVSLADVLEDAKKHLVLRKPRPMFQLKHGTNKWYIFYGWKHVQP
ncbi:expressed unknown protein [Seminavis robusta]|uniref:Uncharacterized protein n=1 Tax=Seminavis robusta TaxID=568900 RepID=A0A9N8ESF7_9STRA|nr:expressed unknown protein [Seminavis robusta]|eukprot:Sro1697_g291870.1 n/a (302) ;mRNA; r:7061-7966